MHVGIIPDTPMERLALALGVIPTPIVETFPPIVLARCVIVATQLGLFTALAKQPATVEALACQCQTQAHTTRLLLDVLVAIGYVRYQRGRYRLARTARRWLDPTNPSTVQPYLAFNATQWDWLGNLKDFITDGEPIQVHHDLSPEQWRLYEDGMRSIARLTLPEVLLRARLPRHAHTMLDIGGGHSLAAIMMCRRHPHLTADVLDLPAALTAAPPLPSDVACRIRRLAGDALTSELGQETYDVIYVANLMHHFDAAQNQCLARRIARALRPGGIWIVQDGVQRDQEHVNQASALGSLYFALTSASGFWSFADFARWQREVGLQPRRPIRLMTAPGQGLQIAIKSQ